GLLSTLLAWWRGAPGIPVLVALLLLLSNFPLAACCWGLAGCVLDLHVVHISNISAREIGPLRIWVEVEEPARNSLEIALLPPGESRTWAFHQGGEASATFRAHSGDLLWEALPEEWIFLGIGQPTEIRLEFLPEGTHRFRGALARRWWWIHGLRP
ncbi:MAG: hypothetical protein ACKOGA_08790, partial [Planctomycetaceae bacterium]